MTTRLFLPAAVLIRAAGSALAAAPDFVKDIAPIIQASCVKCHNATKAKAKLNMETKEGAMKGGESGKFIEAGKPDASLMIKALTLPEDDDAAMPPKDKAPRPTAAQIATLKQWIAAGATWPDGVTVKPTEPAK